jgi:hypothetical protein
MKTLIMTIAASATLLSFASAAMADNTRHQRHARAHNSPSAVAERQRRARTFDPAQYYEHDSRKVPVGTTTWWALKDGEGSTGRP